MAEWSKAPDSRIASFSYSSGLEYSGPLMWAWVRIPLLTQFFHFSPFMEPNTKKITVSAGNRTPINCLEGNYANHYTTDAPGCKPFCITKHPFSQLNLKTKWQQTGIEPQSTAWKATMLTIAPVMPWPQTSCPTVEINFKTSDPSICILLHFQLMQSIH